MLLRSTHRTGRYRLWAGGFSRVGWARAGARAAAVAAACVAAAVPAGCGSARPRPRQVTLILDFTPNAVHAGIYRALAAGYYRAAGIALEIVQPTSTQETLKLIDAGRAQFGLADGSDVASLIARGGDARVAMAI